MKKRGLLMLFALGIAATAMAGLYCAGMALSCFMDGDPSRYPVAFPASVLAGLLCLALFVLLIYGYVHLRKKAPSALWTAVDAILALALVAAVALCFLGCASEQEDPYRVEIRVVEDGTAELAGTKYPCDLYYGECKDGVLELKHRYVGEPVVDVELVSFSVNHNADTHHGSEGSITVKLLSERDQNVKLWMKSYASDDNGASLKGETLALKAGKAEELTFPFEGWSRFHYFVSVEVTLAGADRWDSRLEIGICPPEQP